MEEREKWVQGVVTSLWDELGKQHKDQNSRDGSSMGVLLSSLNSGGGGAPSSSTAFKSEILEMQNVLGQLEQRIKVMKDVLSEVKTEKLDQLD